MSMSTGTAPGPVEPDPSGDRRPHGTLAAEVMTVLHAAGRALTPAEVRASLGDRLSYSTIVTTLSRLHDKGVLRRTPRGRAFAYAPVADEPGLIARAMRQVLDGVPDRQAVLARFVDGLSTGDEALLRTLLASSDQPD
jgi:predicted transcriptional regulator